jgi:hypothetical protein
MFKSQAEIAREYRKRADHYRELASTTGNAEMRLTFLQAIAACEQAAAVAEMNAAQDRGTGKGT